VLLYIPAPVPSGPGSTINSCAIIRFSYSTPSGVTFAWEGAQYWKDWAQYIGAEDELGLIDYHMCGQGRYTGRSIDMGFFSRNRSVNPNSSMSVHG